jgi:hypothetical protein
MSHCASAAGEHYGMERGEGIQGKFNDEFYGVSYKN